MKRWGWVGVLLLGVALTGCGKPADNSAIQTPEDQPIMQPGGVKAAGNPGGGRSVPVSKQPLK